MHNGMSMGFEVTTKEDEGQWLFGDMGDTGSYGETRFNTETIRFDTQRQVSGRMFYGKTVVYYGISKGKYE